MGDKLNVVTAAWIQEEVHDLYGTYDEGEEEYVELGAGRPQCPIQLLRFKTTKLRDDGAFDNFRKQRRHEESVFGAVLDTFVVGCC